MRVERGASDILHSMFKSGDSRETVKETHTIRFIFFNFFVSEFATCEASCEFTAVRIMSDRGSLINQKHTAMKKFFRRFS